jgi:hypothetical protein
VSDPSDDSDLSDEAGGSDLLYGTPATGAGAKRGNLG